jgi:hypothetical protein
VIFNAVRQVEIDSDQYILENLPEELEFILESAGMEASQENGADAEKSKAETAQRELEETIRLVMQLRQLSVNAQINQLRFLQVGVEDPQEAKDLAALLSNLNQLIKLRGQLDKALSKTILLG